MSTQYLQQEHPVIPALAHVGILPWARHSPKSNPMAIVLCSGLLGMLSWKQVEA